MRNICVFIGSRAEYGLLRSVMEEIQITTSLDEMLKNSNIKAVAFSAPAATHYEMVKQSLPEGKNVFAEKCQG